MPSISKKSIRRGIVQLLREYGETVNEHHPCATGILDIKSETCAIAVRHAMQWETALGQSIIHGTALDLQPEVVLYGDAAYEPIVDICTGLGVACSTYPISGGYAMRLIDGIGCWKHCNYEELGAVIRNIRNAHWN